MGQIFNIEPEFLNWGRAPLWGRESFIRGAQATGCKLNKYLQRHKINRKKRRCGSDYLKHGHTCTVYSRFHGK